MAVIDPRVFAPFRSRADRCRDDSGMRERPIPAPQIPVDFLLPKGTKATSLQFLTPEKPDPVPLKWKQADGRIQFSTPQFKVYAVVRVHIES